MFIFSETRYMQTIYQWPQTFSTSSYDHKWLNGDIINLVQQHLSGLCLKMMFILDTGTREQMYPRIFYGNTIQSSILQLQQFYNPLGSSDAVLCQISESTFDSYNDLLPDGTTPFYWTNADLS